MMPTHQHHLAVCNDGPPQLIADAARRRDPTGTLDIRRRFAADVFNRVRQLRTTTRQMVLQNDTIGMGSKQLKEFQDWFNTAAQQLVVGQRGEQSWVGSYVRAAYARGWFRAEKLTGAAHLPDPDKPLLLTVSTATELEGIVAETYRQVTRVLTEAVARGARPREVAGLVADRLEKVLLTRARAMAAFMTVKVFSAATLDAFELAGVQQVGVDPEHEPRKLPSMDSLFVRDAKSRRNKASRRAKVQRPAPDEQFPERVDVLTAGDNDVCPVCEAIAQGGPYSIARARALIPAHPRCRCAFIPHFDLRFQHQELI